MNERIRELMAEADRKCSETRGIYDEILAELIVQECVAICQDTDGEDNIDARSGRQDCAVEIREHFGVES